MNTCLYCNHENATDQRHCEGCGLPLAGEADWLALAPDTELQARYVIRGRIGHAGGFGLTYRAWDRAFEQEVVIKELFVADGHLCTRAPGAATVLSTGQGAGSFSDYKARFKAEARRLRPLTHTHIVKVFDLFEAHNTVYLVQEYLRGGSLKAQVEERGALSEAEALVLIRALAAALGRVHEAGLVHRDIKPENVVYRTPGEPVLIDFGLAREYLSGRSQSAGGYSDGFAPPEQYRAGGAVGPRLDIYGLGALLSYLLTGQVPPTALERLMGAELSLPAGLSAAVRSALTRALALKADERFGSMAELLAALGAGAEGSNSSPVSFVGEKARGRPDVDAETRAKRRETLLEREAHALSATSFVKCGLAWLSDVGDEDAAKRCYLMARNKWERLIDRSESHNQYQPERLGAALGISEDIDKLPLDAAIEFYLQHSMREALASRLTKAGEEALSISFDDVRNLISVARGWYLLGDDKKALYFARFAEILTIEGSPWYGVDVALLYIELGQPDRAQEILYLREFPVFSAVKVVEAWQRLDRREKARDFLAEKESRAEEEWVHIAQAWHRLADGANLDRVIMRAKSRMNSCEGRIRVAQILLETQRKDAARQHLLETEGRWRYGRWDYLNEAILWRELHDMPRYRNFQRLAHEHAEDLMVLQNCCEEWMQHDDLDGARACISHITSHASLWDESQKLEGWVACARYWHIIGSSKEVSFCLDRAEEVRWATKYDHLRGDLIKTCISFGMRDRAKRLIKEIVDRGNSKQIGLLLHSGAFGVKKSPELFRDAALRLKEIWSGYGDLIGYFRAVGDRASIVELLQNEETRRTSTCSGLMWVIKEYLENDLRSEAIPLVPKAAALADSFDDYINLYRVNKTLGNVLESRKYLNLAYSVLRAQSERTQNEWICLADAFVAEDDRRKFQECLHKAESDYKQGRGGWNAIVVRWLRAGNEDEALRVANKAQIFV